MVPLSHPEGCVVPLLIFAEARRCLSGGSHTFDPLDGGGGASGRWAPRRSPGRIARNPSASPRTMKAMQSLAGPDPGINVCATGPAKRGGGEGWGW